MISEIMFVVGVMLSGASVGLFFATASLRRQIDAEWATLDQRAAALSALVAEGEELHRDLQAKYEFASAECRRWAERHVTRCREWALDPYDPKWFNADGEIDIFRGIEESVQ